MGPGSHITISNVPHHYSVYTKTLSSPTHNLMSLILHHFSFFHSDWQWYDIIFGIISSCEVRIASILQCCTYTKPHTLGKRETTGNDGSDDNTYSHVFTLETRRFYVHSMIGLKDMKAKKI